MTDPTTEQVLSMAANDQTVSDGVFILLSRALAGRDPLTGKHLEPALPARMTGRGWHRGVMDRVEVDAHCGWYWRCPCRSCPAWGGPFRHEGEAFADGRAQHHGAHRKA